MLPSMKGHSLREVTTKSGSTQYIVCVDMEFKFIDGDSGEELTLNMSGEGQDVGDKAIYKAISGAQKYALMKAFMIPTGDDPEYDGANDGSSNDSQSTKPALSGVASKAQLSAIESAIRSLKLTKKQFIDIVNQQLDAHHETTEAAIASLSVKDADTIIQYLADYKKGDVTSA